LFFLDNKKDVFMDVNRFLLTLTKKTENFLTWRKRRRLKKREKLKKKNAAMDWAEAFLSAVVIVFFLNQYLIQAYQIPTQSMVHTLEIGDRIFVNKLICGPELLPGLVKFPGFRSIRRGDIAIFESPEYISKGTVHDIVTRIVYMMTFSFIDLDRDENGQPAKHFLIKRVPSVSGDRLRVVKGELNIMPAGENEWIPEEKLKAMTGLTYNLNTRFFKQDDYNKFQDAGTGLALRECHLGLSGNQETRVNEYYDVIEDDNGYVYWKIKKYSDMIFIQKIRNKTLSAIRPHVANSKKEWLKLELGRYIPDGYIFPMGDNRDNSRDARYFGPVNTKKVLGKSLFRFWPFNRFGGI
jgi:signal peptidase I